MIKLPREDDECKSGYAVLDNAMYGTKDAAQCFDVASENAMTAMVFDTGTFSPGLHHSSAVDMFVFRPGDHFVVSGTRIEEHLSKHLIVKHLATLGPCTALGDVTEVKILNRIVRWAKPPYGSGRERIEHLADPRHAELIIHQPGLSCSSRSVSTPSEKSKPGVPNSANHTLYRSPTMRLCCLALDRPDLQFPSKELARWMQPPTVGNLEALKRVTRYLTGHGRLVQEFVRQVEEPSHDVVFTDSDHAGCLKNTQKHIFIQVVPLFPHASFHEHYARSYRPELARSQSSTLQ